MNKTKEIEYLEKKIDEIDEECAGHRGIIIGYFVYLLISPAALIFGEVGLSALIVYLVVGLGLIPLEISEIIPLKKELNKLYEKKFFIENMDLINYKLKEKLNSTNFNLKVSENAKEAIERNKDAKYDTINYGNIGSFTYHDLCEILDGKQPSEEDLEDYSNKRREYYRNIRNHKKGRTTIVYNHNAILKKINSNRKIIDELTNLKNTFCISNDESHIEMEGNKLLIKGDNNNGK